MGGEELINRIDDFGHKRKRLLRAREPRFAVEPLCTNRSGL